MSATSIFVIPETLEAESKILVKQLTSDDCFKTQVNNEANKKFYSTAVKKSLQNNISNLKSIILQAKDELNTRIQITKKQIDLLQTKIDAISSDADTVNTFFSLIDPIIPQCVTTAKVSGRVFTLASLKTAEKSELLYRQKLANQMVVELGNRLGLVTDVLVALDAMNGDLNQ